VLGLRTSEKDGYAAARIAFDVVPERKLTKAELGMFKKASLEPHRHVVEIRGYEGLEIGRAHV
jgi:large subunit ribosomal protein L3